MVRWNGLLLAAVLASCLLLVKTAHESRQLFAALDSARGEQRQLQAEARRLDAERQAQGTSLRVEKVARQRLRMAAAPQGVVQEVFDTPASGAAR